jgi:4-amino-4-deoxy-L-arabinose transferase-like glycosyltransferase
MDMTQIAVGSGLGSIPQNDTIPRRWKMRWDRIGLVAMLVLYAALLLSRFAPAISEPDDNGYFAQGTLLVKTGHTWFVPQSDAQYIGMHWLLTPSGHYISRYPPGLAVLIGAVYAIGGWKTATLVNPALSVAALVGMFALARRIGLNGAWSLAAVALLAANQTFVHHALSGDSHMAVTCCLVSGMVLLIRWSQEGKLWQIFAAGIVLGTIATIRYPDAIMGLAILVFILWRARELGRFGQHLFSAFAGAAVPILPLLLRNQLLLGRFWRTGYALTHEQTGFGWDYFRMHATQYLQSIQGNGVGLLFALGVVGIAYMICTKTWRSVGVLLALLVVPMLLLYMAYYWGGMGAMSMRFLLPTFPMYVLAGVWVLAELTKNATKAARVTVPIVVIAVQMLSSVPTTLAETQRLHETKRSLAIATEALEQTAQPGDVIVANNQFLQNLDFVRHWKLADASIVRGGFGGGPGGPMGGGPPAGGARFSGPRDDQDPDAPSPMQQEKREARAALYKGTTRQRTDKFLSDIKDWAHGHAIYLVGTEAEVNRMLSDAVPSKQIEIVKRVTLPPVSIARISRGDGPGFGAPGMGPGGGGFTRRGGPRFSGPGIGGPGGPGMGGPGMGAGGPMGMDWLGDAKEIVIARLNSGTGASPVQK